MKLLLLPCTLITFALPIPAAADPAVGFGFSITSDGELAIGARVFSDNRPGKGVAAIGLDYKTGSESWRPTIGAAWLEDGFYVDLSAGYDTKANKIDFGGGVGVTGRVSPAPAPAPATGGGTGGGTGGTDATTRVPFSF